MAATVHEWSDRPIVTLVSEFWTYDTNWEGPSSKTFKGSMSNVLKVKVEFKYTKSYGGDASYRVWISQLFGTDWITRIVDEVSFEAKDQVWESEYKDYQLSLSFPFPPSQDKKMRFRITTQIEGPGHYSSGSRPGSLGYWSEPESREFTATFKKPVYKLVAAYVDNMQAALKDGLEHYRRRK